MRKKNVNFEINTKVKESTETNKPLHLILLNINKTKIKKIVKNTNSFKNHNNLKNKNSIKAY